MPHFRDFPCRCRAVQGIHGGDPQGRVTDQKSGVHGRGRRLDVAQKAVEGFVSIGSLGADQIQRRRR